MKPDPYSPSAVLEGSGCFSTAIWTTKGAAFRNNAMVAFSIGLKLTGGVSDCAGTALMQQNKRRSNNRLAPRMMMPQELLRSKQPLFRTTQRVDQFRPLNVKAQKKVALPRELLHSSFCCPSLMTV